MRTFISIILLCMAAAVSAQQLPLDIEIENNSTEMTDITLQNLETKLRQAVADNGINGGANYSQFALVAVPNVISKEVISGIRPMISLTADISFFIKNKMSDERYTARTVQIRGGGTNETKAWVAALSTLRDKGDFRSFMEEGKRKIINYYNENTTAIIRQARTMAIQQDYARALYLLSAVPYTSDRYSEVEACMLDVWQQYTDFLCSQNLAKARALWNANQTKTVANAIAVFLSEIYPDAACYDEAMRLEEEIRARIGDEWTFEKKAYQDEVDLRSQQIEAARAVGIAFGTNQKADTSSTNLIIK